MPESSWYYTVFSVLYFVLGFSSVNVVGLQSTKAKPKNIEDVELIFMSFQAHNLAIEANEYGMYLNLLI